MKTKLENFKYYTSLVLGTLCIVSIFAFLFLVPFVLDPAISTLMHEFVDEPVTCRVSVHGYTMHMYIHEQRKIRLILLYFYDKMNGYFDS